MRAKDIVRSLACRPSSPVSNLSISTPFSTLYCCNEVIQSARWLAVVQPHSLCQCRAGVSGTSWGKETRSWRERAAHSPQQYQARYINEPDSASAVVTYTKLPVSRRAHLCCKHVTGSSKSRKSTLCLPASWRSRPDIRVVEKRILKPCSIPWTFLGIT